VADRPLGQPQQHGQPGGGGRRQAVVAAVAPGRLPVQAVAGRSSSNWSSRATLEPIWISSPVTSWVRTTKPNGQGSHSSGVSSCS
jgi:hypothetical protein